MSDAIAMGELRIGPAPGLTEVARAAPVEDLRQGVPQLALRVTTQWTGALIEEVRSGGLDCALGLLVGSRCCRGQASALLLALLPATVVVAGVALHRPG